MKATIEWAGEVQFRAATESGHSLTMDGPSDAGGKNAGCRPMEMVLVGLGGCASYDVVTILEKSRQQVARCATELSAERAESPPKVFTRIHLHFIVEGKNLSHEKVARAVHLSAEKYCSASIMLARGGVDITHTFVVHESTEDRQDEGN